MSRKAFVGEIAGAVYNAGSQQWVLSDGYVAARDSAVWLQGTVVTGCDGQGFLAIDDGSGIIKVCTTHVAESLQSAEISASYEEGDYILAQGTLTTCTNSDGTDGNGLLASKVQSFWLSRLLISVFSVAAGKLDGTPRA